MIVLSSCLSVEVVSSNLLESDSLGYVKIGNMFVCSGVCKLSSVFVCKPCGGHKCPSHVFVRLCKDYVIVFAQIVDVGCERLSDVEVLWIEKVLEVCRL